MTTIDVYVPRAEAAKGNPQLNPTIKAFRLARAKAHRDGWVIVDTLSTVATVKDYGFRFQVERDVRS